MDKNLVILLPVLLPVVMGVVLLVLPKDYFGDRRKLIGYFGAALLLAAVSLVSVLVQPQPELELFRLVDMVPILFRADGIGKIFAGTVMVVWVLAGAYAVSYMKEDAKEKQFFGCYLIVLGVLMAIDFAGNLVTFYLFYECMTLATVLLVIHDLTKEARMAGLKYLFYSLGGAYMCLFGIYFLYQNTTTLNFVPGGSLIADLKAANQSVLLVAVFLMLLGLGVKAGMFPFHAWLPTAHPVAPTPASAVLSGVIVKMGVLGIIRVVYYVVGAEFLRGTWVQTVWLILILFTVFMGSMLAYQEPVMKKRLAYSTVSQISYILFGLAMLNPLSFTGAVLHVVFHAVIKCGLFLCAGTMIRQTGKKRAAEWVGIGREMPVLLGCYTVLSLALIGIPPLSGFVSKWYLGIGGLDAGIKVFSWLGPVILLVSALLTAGYLLPVTVRGYFPGREYQAERTQEKTDLWMLLPVVMLVVLTIAGGVASGGLVDFIMKIAERIL